MPEIKSKKKRPKRKISNRGLGVNGAMYAVVTELASSSSDLAFGQLICADSDKANGDIPRFLSRSAKVRRSSTAAAAAQNTGIRCLRSVRNIILGYEMDAVVGSEAISNLKSETLFNNLDPELDRHFAGLIEADGKRSSSIRAAQEVSSVFCHVHLTNGILCHGKFAL